MALANFGAEAFINLLLKSALITRGSRSHNVILRI